MGADHGTICLSHAGGRCIHFWFISSAPTQSPPHHNDLVFHGEPNRGFCVFKRWVWAKQAQVYVTNTEQVSSPGNSHCGHMKDQLHTFSVLKPAAQLQSVFLTSLFPLVHLKPSRWWNFCGYQTISAKCNSFVFFPEMKFQQKTNPSNQLSYD